MIKYKYYSLDKYDGKELVIKNSYFKKNSIIIV